MRNVLTTMSFAEAGEVASRLDPMFLVGGNLRVPPARVYKELEPREVRVWANVRGFYCLPTYELVEWLTEQINGRSAIEIGAGNGSLARELGIRATDSWLQNEPEIKKYYEAVGVATAPYGEDVEKIDALDAVRKYRPQVVIGAWVTEWIHPDLPPPPWGGNIYGIKEWEILDFESVETYIMIGHVNIHGMKSIRRRSHSLVFPEWLVSRAEDPNGDMIMSWQR